MLELSCAVIIAVALNVYLLLGGADYGGGVWDLLATGTRKERQRRLIERSIGPIWEANHVWLIAAIVFLFTAFPPAFSRIMTFLHLPLLLMLLGIVFRGSAFAFRSYEARVDFRRRWGTVFAAASLLTPVLLGTVIGAIAWGRVDGELTSAAVFLTCWLGVFPLSVGVYALAMVAFLAATYLTVEAEEEDLQEDFRRRALLSALFLGFMAAWVLGVASFQAPEILEDLTRTRWSWALHAVTAASALGAMAALWRRHFHLARALAALQVSLIVWGWAFSQYPHLVKPDLTLYEAAAPAVTLRLLLIILAVGSLILAPSLYYLFRVFGKIGGPGAPAKNGT
ncbi:MAG TPA: cytochrome d ubiquinol oxidase subunit II [Acidobacteriota bacterium]|nr:cytochrome d ubiquinol oxidase subunit II [Acidobacteriota bacterium]